MSTNIDRDQTFLGLPLLKVRNVLKAWRYGRTTDAHDIALRKDVDLNPFTVMVLLEELQARKVEIEIQDVAGLPSTGVLACFLSDEMPELLRAVHRRVHGGGIAARVSSPKFLARLG